LESDVLTAIYHLAPGNLKRLAVQKKNWTDIRPVHIETAEISRSVCCFEWEGEQAFQVGDALDFYFALEDSSLRIGAAILDVDRCEFLDEGYVRKTWFAYCAQFDRELEGEFLMRIVGPKRVCKSLYRVKWDNKR
jgi:hypothetical protein